MLATIKRWLGLGFGDEKTAPAKRSAKWPAVRKAFLFDNPRCVCCGSTEGVVPHHVRPFHVFPELELDTNNLVALCEGDTLNCHLWIGHFGHFTKWWNPDCAADSERFRAMLGKRTMKL